MNRQDILFQTGDDKLSLFRELPLAIRMDGFVTYNFNDAGNGRLWSSVCSENPFRR